MSGVGGVLILMLVAALLALAALLCDNPVTT